MARTLHAHVLVMAKAPVAGHVKTRLHASYAPTEAALLAEAALRDTLDAVRACRAGRRVVALDGERGPWLGHDFEVIPQVDGDLADRLGAAWRAAGGPGLQIGMDTPQVRAEQLDAALGALLRPRTDAVLGLATDGGWWAIGLRRPVPGLFDGIPMSQDNTGTRQLERLGTLGLRTVLLPELADMDRPADVAALARDHPHLRVASIARSLAVDWAVAR